MLKSKRIQKILLIFLCFIVYVFSNGQHAVPLFVWIYPVLFLIFLGSCRSMKSVFIIFAIYAAGFVIQFAEVIGMSFWICVAAAAAVSALRTLPYVLFIRTGKKFQSTVIFASAMTAIDYLIYLAYPSLGGLSDAYTQYQNLLLIQISTLFGIYGIIFIICWTAAMIAWLWGNRSNLSSAEKPIFIYAAVIGCVFAYNACMLYIPITQDKSVRIGAVTVPVSQLLNNDEDVSAVFYSDSFTDENMAETRRKLSGIHEELFIKTNNEAVGGAKIVFWSELNGAVMKEDEEAVLKLASATARNQKIFLIVSLLVKTPYENLKENKTVAFDPEGKFISEYYKYGRSIGELCLKGDGKIKYFDTEYGRLSPFICSDLAFTSEINQAGRSGTDIMIVPASDWREMTSVAIRTAVIRGVENGCNVVRHTNQGISVTSDFRGNILSLSDYYTSETKTMACEVPTSGRFTIYPYIGNLLAYVCVGYIILFFLYNVKRRKSNKV